MVELGIDQEGGAFHGVGEVGAEFPGHDAVYCVAAIVFWAIVGAVELLPDGEEVGGVFPGGYRVAGHFSRNLWELTPVQSVGTPDPKWHTVEIFGIVVYWSQPLEARAPG